MQQIQLQEHKLIIKWLFHLLLKTKLIITVSLNKASEEPHVGTVTVRHVW